GGGEGGGGGGEGRAGERGGATVGGGREDRRAGGAGGPPEPPQPGERVRAGRLDVPVDAGARGEGGRHLDPRRPVDHQLLRHAEGGELAQESLDVGADPEVGELPRIEGNSHGAPAAATRPRPACTLS